LNGWTKEQETLMAEWADIAGCYRWLHDRAEKIFTRSNMLITIPVIILSTLTGTANFAVGSFVPEGDQSLKKLVSASIGAVSIFAGILSTLGNFFQYAQKSESHKVAGINWGKFQRQVTVELAIHPDERIDAMDFLKICRQDLDRLIEQSPPIPDAVIGAFEREFKTIPNLKVPDICHGIEHTRVYDASKTRLSKLTADAALHLKYKKGVLKDSILPDIDRKIQAELASRIEERIKQLMPAPPPPPPAEATKAKEGLTAVVSNLETDWRKLLVSRKHLMMPMPTGARPLSMRVRGDDRHMSVFMDEAGPAATLSALNTIVSSPDSSSSSVIIDIVGSGGTAPSEAAPEPSPPTEEQQPPAAQQLPPGTVDFS
jgi:hypothetical protein